MLATVDCAWPVVLMDVRKLTPILGDPRSICRGTMCSSTYSTSIVLHILCMHTTIMMLHEYSYFSAFRTNGVTDSAITSSMQQLCCPKRYWDVQHFIMHKNGLQDSTIPTMIFKIDAAFLDCHYRVWRWISVMTSVLKMILMLRGDNALRIPRNSQNLIMRSRWHCGYWNSRKRESSHTYMRSL